MKITAEVDIEREKATELLRKLKDENTKYAAYICRELSKNWEKWEFSAQKGEPIKDTYGVEYPVELYSQLRGTNYKNFISLRGDMELLQAGMYQVIPDMALELNDKISVLKEELERLTATEELGKSITSSDPDKKPVVLVKSTASPAQTAPTAPTAPPAPTVTSKDKSLEPRDIKQGSGGETAPTKETLNKQIWVLNKQLDYLNNKNTQYAACFCLCYAEKVTRTELYPSRRFEESYGLKYPLNIFKKLVSSIMDTESERKGIIPKKDLEPSYEGAIMAAYPTYLAEHAEKINNFLSKISLKLDIEKNIPNLRKTLNEQLAEKTKLKATLFGIKPPELDPSFTIELPPMTTPAEKKEIAIEIEKNDRIMAELIWDLDRVANVITGGAVLGGLKDAKSKITSGFFSSKNTICDPVAVAKSYKQLSESFEAIKKMHNPVFSANLIEQCFISSEKLNKIADILRKELGTIKIPVVGEDGRFYPKNFVPNLIEKIEENFKSKQPSEDDQLSIHMFA